MMTDRIAIYAGSFDPIHNGHIAIIERAAKLFITRKVHVIVANNLDKKHMFNIDERISIVRKSLSHLKDKIEIISYSGIIADYIKENNVDVSVRGIRNSTDFSYEVQVEQFTRDTTGIETVYLSPYTQDLNTSSSLLRMFIQSGNIQDARKYMNAKGFSQLIFLNDLRGKEKWK